MSGGEEVRRVELSSEAVQAADQIRQLTGLASIEDAIRVALGDELYFRKKIKDGYHVLVRRGDDYLEVDLTPQKTG